MKKLTILLFTITIAIALALTSLLLTIHHTGVIKTVGAVAYEMDGSTVLNAINWGLLEPGQTKHYYGLLKSKCSVMANITYTTTGVPQNITVGLSYQKGTWDGTTFNNTTNWLSTYPYVIAPTEWLKLRFSVYIHPTISITTFSYDIIITIEA